VQSQGLAETNHPETVNAAGLPAVTTGNFNSCGGLAGGTIGYNFQMGQWLVGAEADLDWSNINGTFNGTIPVAGVGRAAFSLSSQLNWLDTTRVRVGSVWDHTLFLRHGWRRARWRDRHGEGVGGRGRPGRLSEASRRPAQHAEPIGSHRTPPSIAISGRRTASQGRSRTMITC
jgi:hypothetical protein